MMRHATALAAAVTVMLGATAANAQKPTWRERAEAQQRYQQGKLLVRRGKFEEAAEKFREADGKDPQPAYKLELARMLLEQGAFSDASALLDACEEAAPQLWIQKQAQKQCATLAEEVDERTPKLGVSVFAPEASLVTVSVDGSPVDPDAGPIALDPGDYEVTAVADGYEDFRQTVTLAEGETEAIEISLTKSVVVVEDDDEASGGGLSPVPAYVAWGVGAAGLGVGIGFGVLAIQSTNQVLRDFECVNDSCPPEAEDDLNASKLQGNVSTAGFVIGFTGVVAGTVLFLLSGDDDEKSPKQDDDDTVAVQPLLGPGFVGLQGDF
ncbi:MAG: tetratricopeptide repeat protein [Myxococcota bacterium]